MGSSPEEEREGTKDTQKASDTGGNTGGEMLLSDVNIQRETMPSNQEHDSIHQTQNTSEEPRLTVVKSSTSLHELIVVPREKRRGLFARFALIPEVENPKDYSRRTKWTLTAFVALAAAAGPMASAIFMPSLPQVAVDLNTQPKIANLSVALYMLSMAIFPLWWSSFSETLGRRSIYLTSFFLFTLFSIISALSTTISMLIVFRILSGGAAAAVQAVGAGSIADIWEPRERGQAMGIFYLGPLAGPLIAPIIGGGLSQAWNWRATQWFQVIYGGLTFVIIVLSLPETLARKVNEASLPITENEPDAEKGMRPALTRMSTRQSVKVKTKRYATIFHRCFIEPLSVLLYLRFPAILLITFLASVAFGSLYILNISLQESFSSPPYNFKVSIVGLLYIPPSLGYLAASLIGGKWSDQLMIASAKKENRYDSTSGKLVYHPEDRLSLNAWLAAGMFPTALLIYGWTVERNVVWPIPIIINFFFGFGSMIIFGVATTMLTEFMPKKSSSGVAVNNFMRNVFSSAGGVIAEPLISAIGNGWLFTIVAVVGWVTAFGVVWAMRSFGPKWRIVMDEKLSVSS